MLNLLAVHPSYVIALIVVFSFIITMMSIPVIIKVAQLKHLYDEPDFDRKVHRSRIPTLGGVGIFSGLILSFLIAKDFYSLIDIKYLVPALFILFFAGIKDDVLVLTPIKKLMAQLASAFIVVVLGGIKINSFYGLFGLQELPYLISVVFSMMAIVAIINSYNLIDGVDGLAGSLGVVSAFSFGVWFYLIEQWTPAFLAFSLVGSVLGFLKFNYSPAQIFMGDTGAMIIGFVLAVLSIHFIELNKNLIANENFWIHASPSVAMGVMSIPIFDMLRVFFTRIIRKRSPFKPDRNHIHHLLSDFGLNHQQITWRLTSFNILIIVLCFYFKDIKSSYLLVVLLLVVFVPKIILHVARNKWTEAGQKKL